MKYSRAVQIWLIIGLIMVFFQVIIGGITRLTESGLSITEWNVLSGTFPPLDNATWTQEFEKYKLTPQYVEINEGMDLNDFKFIYFFEYLHRLWARVMGFVFLFPFLYFWLTKKLDVKLIKNLLVVIFFAILAAIFGWIMVKSGLTKRPWVNAYKLSIHLSIAIAVFLSLLYTFLETLSTSIPFKITKAHKTLFVMFSLLLILQLELGGMMSGMKAAVMYPTWPTMHGEFLPSVLLQADAWKWEHFIMYDGHPFMGAFVQFFHRMVAYIVFVLGIVLSYRWWYQNSDNNGSKRLIMAFLVSLCTQVILGITTLLLSKGEIPVSFGVLHQGCALILISVTFLIWYYSRRTI